MAKAEQAMAEMRTVIEKNFENVGEKFPEEARRIHYGEIEARGIRGKANADERRALLEEGIEVMSLPMPSALEQHVHDYDVDVMDLQRAVRLIPADGPGEPVGVELENGAVLRSKSVILSTGARWRSMGVPAMKKSVARQRWPARAAVASRSPAAARRSVTPIRLLTSIAGEPCVQLVRAGVSPPPAQWYGPPAKTPTPVMMLENATWSCTAM